jgi:zinc transport system permease protein
MCLQMNDIFYIPLITLLILAILLAPLGCFLMWKRMTFLADTMSHSSILGVGIGLFFNISTILASLTYLVLFVFMLKLLLKKETLPQDSVLSLLSYGGMSLGLILISLTPHKNAVDKVLFGDLLSVENHELLILLCMTIFSAVFIMRYHKKLVCLVTDRNLAIISGIPVTFLENFFIFIIAFSIGFSMKIAGALVVPALLIIPALAATRFAPSYKAVILFSTLFSLILAPVSLYVVYEASLPIGPVIIFVYILGFSTIQLTYKLRYVFTGKFTPTNFEG